ncbi:MAG: hypothetical protein ABI662_03230 [Dermatophilaceae bacterium]
MKLRYLTRTKPDRVQSTARALKSYDKEHLLVLAGLFHVEVLDELVSKDALVTMIARAAWS